MLVGHYAPASLIKAVQPRMPLWLLFVAVQLTDIAWAIFVLAGVERVRIVPGFTASTPLDLYYMPYSHSLLATVLWAAAAGLAYRSWPPGQPWRAALLVALAVLSHWCLDVAVHAPDLPLYGDQHKLGWGLWNYPVPSLVLEIGLPLACAAMMVARQPSMGGAARRGVIALCLLLAGIQLYSLLGPIPGAPAPMAATTLTLYVVLAVLAAGIDRLWALPSAGRPHIVQ